MNNENQNIINSIRVLSSEAIQKANSGHPGLPLGCASLSFTLFSEKLKHAPSNPDWLNRDRFVLSAGHGCMLLYSLLYLFKYGITIEDLKQFRQYQSKTPGHPESTHTKGVESTTGPLGQGLANAVGMAISESFLSTKFNKPDYNVIDHYTYVLAGDGCMMEGITNEAASLAGTLALDKLIVIYDSNSITIEGSTDIAFTEDVGKRFEALGWMVINVNDGNDPVEFKAALDKATSDTTKPKLIVAKTIIGYGCDAKAGSPSAHGEPIGAENVEKLKEKYGFKSEPFWVPEDLSTKMDEIIANREKDLESWTKLYEGYKANFPDAAKELEAFYNNDFDVNFLLTELMETVATKPIATRSSSGNTIQHIAKKIPNFFGGSADLAPSNKTYMNGKGDFSKSDRTGMNMHFGVREHAMASIANGISLHGGLKPFVSTFFVFSDYMKSAIRMSAIMNLPVTYVLTHDSIGVGEDGPTHQPVEHLIALRSIPNLVVFRPADDRETLCAWHSALSSKDHPTALILTRQNLPQIENSGVESLKGAYIVVKESSNLDLILISNGSELGMAVTAAQTLKEKGYSVRVVSMPSWELFEAQSADYKEQILPKNVKNRMSIEAGSSMGWHKYVGSDGDTISIDTFGISAPYELVYKEFGITVENIIEKSLKLLENK